MVETAVTDGEPPSNLTSPQIPHMNRVETSIVGTRRDARPGIDPRPGVVMKIQCPTGPTVPPWASFGRGCAFEHIVFGESHMLGGDRARIFRPPVLEGGHEPVLEGQARFA